MKTIYYIVVLILLSLDFACVSSNHSVNQDTADTEQLETVETRETESQNNVTFHTAYDVMDYLGHKKFVSTKNTLEIINNCIYANGQCISGAVEIVSYNLYQAKLQAVSPYAQGYINLLVDCNIGVIADLNSNEKFYEQ